MTTILEVIAAWKEFGVFEFYLPFILMFAIFYGLLSKSKIFGDEKERRVRSLNTVIALVAALSVMVWTPLGISLTEFFSNFFTQILVIFMTILAFLMITYMVVPADAIADLFKNKPERFILYIFPIALVTALLVFLYSGGLGIFGIEADGDVGLPGIAAEDLITVVILVLVILAIWFIIKGEGGTKGRPKKTEGWEWSLVPKKPE